VFDAALAQPSIDREVRAREWIQALAELPERSAGTPSERTAADRVAGWLRTLGIDAATTVPVQSAPRAGLSLALHMGVGGLGCFLGGPIGTLLALLALVSFRSEMRARRPLLSRLFRPADSVNVIGRRGPEHPSRRLVLSAHIDAAQAGWLFAPALADIFARNSQRTRANRQPPGPHALTELILLAGVVLSAAGWFGAHGALFSVLRFGVYMAMFVGCGLGVQWAWSPTSPGANDNASAVAAMLTCAEQVLPHLPSDVELLVVGTGAEEVGCVGMHRFLGEHPGWPPEQTFFVNFECVGGGALHYIRSEGVLGKVIYPPTLLDLARRVAAGGGFGDVTPADLLAGTDGHVPAELGYPTLSLISLEANGVPRNYHRPEDTAEGIDTAMVVRAADFGAAVAIAALNGATGPLQVTRPQPMSAAASAG
jgi:hypothetical protein